MPRQKSKVKKERFVIQIRLQSLEERELFDEYSSAAGMNLSDYIRFTGIHIPPRTRKATPKRKPLIQLSAGLGKIGSNLDQIDKGIKDKNYYSDNLKETVIIEAKKSHERLADQVLKMLDSGRAKANYDLEILNRLVTEFDPIGSDINQIAKVMNDKSYYSIQIKEVVITEKLKSFTDLSDQTLKLLQGGLTGENKGERQPVSQLPLESSGQ